MKIQNFGCECGILYSVSGENIFHSTLELVRIIQILLLVFAELLQ